MSVMNIMNMVEAKDLLDFSQNFAVTRSYLGDTLFPDTKTQNMKAEFYRLSDQRMLPTMAMVHSLDAEAHIGQRPTMEKVELEKMLIKEKINQSERVQMWLDNGADQNGIVRYIFDDVARLSESVKTRTEVMKCEALCKGKVTVKENNVNLEVDYNVPSENRLSFNWAETTADVLGDLQNLMDQARLNGQTIRQLVTSTKIMALLRKNEGIQTSIYSALGKGTYVSNTMISNLFSDMFGVKITTYDEYYRYEDRAGNLVSKRYFDEDKLVAISPMQDGSLGRGLWGATPEERAQGPWTQKNATQFITSVMWEEPDPVAVWTKSSGLFVPVIPNPQGLYIGTVTLTKATTKNSGK